MTNSGAAKSGSGGVNWRNLLTLGSITLLVAVELIGAAIAGGWALAGLLDLGTTLEYVFMAVFALLGIWGTVKFYQSGLVIEPVFRRRA